MILFEKSLTRRRGGAESGAWFAKCAWYLCVLFLAASFLVLGCKQEPDDNSLASLDGTWVSEYEEVFIIDFTDMSYKNPADGDYGDYTVEGDIRGIVYFNSFPAAGIIYIEITKKGNEFTVSNDADKYTGIHFKYLNNTTVEFSTAADSTTYETPTYDTLAAAKQALNVNSLGTYFGMGSACTKQ